MILDNDVQLWLYWLKTTTSVWSKVQMTCIMSSWCYGYRIISASLKSRMVYSSCTSICRLSLKKATNKCCSCKMLLCTLIIDANWCQQTFETNSVRGSVTSRKCFRRPTNVSYIPQIAFHMYIVCHKKGANLFLSVINGFYCRFHH